MILTNEEIKAIRDNTIVAERYGYERAIEAAILAKLASAELPEPVGAYEKVVGTEIWHGFPSEIVEMQDAYSADQLRQAYAQGAAAQLAEKPEAYGCRTADGVVRDCIGPDGLLEYETQYTVPLYTRKESK